MHRFYWALLLFVVVSLRSIDGDVADAIGNTLGWLLVASVPTVIWWLITRKKSKVVWQWFNWLNATATIMALLVSLSTLTNHWAQSELTKRPISAESTTSVPAPIAAPTYDTKGWTEESTNSTETGPWLKYDPPGTRYYRDAANTIYRLYPPGTKPNSAPANPFGLGDSSVQVPPPH